MTVSLAAYACGISLLVFGRSNVMMVLRNLLSLYISLLFSLGSNSMKKSGKGCLVSCLTILLICFKWSPKSFSSLLMSLIFVFGCIPLSNALELLSFFSWYV